MAERVRAWLAWLGVARLVATSFGVLAVAVAGFWLVRAPAPPAEATLPIATDPSSPATPSDDPVAGTTRADREADGASDVDAADEPDESGSGRIVVHVAGHVVTPGVYQLGEARRVHDAIEVAGGGTDDADLDAVNLAQELFDGQRLYVPAVGETDVAASDLISPLPDSGSAPDRSPPGPIDVNRATTEQLEALPGIGPSTAKAIVDERNRNGPFATIDDLERVPGIGPAKLDTLRGLVAI